MHMFLTLSYMSKTSKLNCVLQKQIILAKIVGLIRNYHNHKLQTNPWHREEEPHNNHETSGRQTKQSNQLSLPHQDDCKNRREINVQQNIDQ